MGKDAVDDVLILHLENGKDYFVSVSGTYTPTCFGMALEVLNKLEQPVLQSREQLRLIQQGGDVPPTLSVPKELWRMVDFLFRFGLSLVRSLINI